MKQKTNKKIWTNKYLHLYKEVQKINCINQINMAKMKNQSYNKFNSKNWKNQKKNNNMKILKSGKNKKLKSKNKQKKMNQINRINNYNYKIMLNKIIFKMFWMNKNKKVFRMTILCLMINQIKFYNQDTCLCSKHKIINNNRKCNFSNSKN